MFFSKFLGGLKKSLHICSANHLLNNRTECRTKACIDIAGIFYVRIVCSTKDIGIRVPPCMCLMAIQHLTLNVISSGTGTDTIFYYYDE